MTTIAEVAHAIADDIERLGHGGGLHGGKLSKYGPCCVVLNPTIGRLGSAVLVQSAWPHVAASSFALAWIQRLLGIQTTLGFWSDFTSTGEVLARLRAIDDQTVIPMVSTVSLTVPDGEPGDA